MLEMNKNRKYYAYINAHKLKNKEWEKEKLNQSRRNKCLLSLIFHRWLVL
jgi:hypothetical protein